MGFPSCFRAKFTNMVAIPPTSGAEALVPCSTTFPRALTDGFTGRKKNSPKAATSGYARLLLWLTSSEAREASEAEQKQPPSISPSRSQSTHSRGNFWDAWAVGLLCSGCLQPRQPSTQCPTPLVSCLVCLEKPCLTQLHTVEG